MPKTIRMTQNGVNQEALRLAHPYQRTVVEYLMKEKGWNVQSVIPNLCGGDLIGTNLRINRKQVVVISMHTDNGFIGIAPNGMVFGKRPGKNKIEWDWKRMADLAEATIPAAHAVFGNLPEKVS